MSLNYSKYLERVSRWWSQKSSASAWWSHFYTRSYTRSFSKGRQPAPKRYKHSSLIIGDKFQEHWWKSGRKLSPKTVSWVGISLESSVPLHFYFSLSFTRQQTPNWIPGCCGCHECPSISREWPWCPLTLLLFQPGHGAGWSPHTLTLWGSSHMETPNINAAVPDLIHLQFHMSYLSSSSVLF